MYTYLPDGLPARDAPIVFVMHGTSRTAENYRNVWIEHAGRYRFMVVAPRFDRERWGRGAYTYASVVTREGGTRDRALWSFSVIEHLFDAIKARTGNAAARYRIYGHSEGGQFVHRLVLLLPDARYERAVAANAGWYTMPRFDVAFPYGLKGSPATAASLSKSLARELVILLGERDNDPEHHQLRRTPRALAQGANRVERGEDFFATARARAAELHAPFGWTLEYVPGAGHSNAQMAGAAAALLMQ
ncbi:MAG: hypothetical protein IT529_17420 [Burkholderiales bacterium]|nr:hypothetical protein [Burkholderiales bacterium]